jgi:amino acid adenylation domain-containing protein
MSEFSALPDSRNTQLHTSFIVKLSASGSASRWISAIGDWSWEYVSRQCGVNVLRARNADGKPSYLAFCYLRILGGPGLQCNLISPGDELDVSTSGFRGSADSLSVVHQIRHKSGSLAFPLATYEELQSGDEHSLIVEGFHRWLVRSQEGDNDDLARSQPAGYRSEHLPGIPDAHHPWRRYRPAIERLSFREGDEWSPPGDEIVLPYRVDGDRDLNGVGLLYFASYFDLFQLGAREAARRAGWPETAFQRRVVAEQEVVFLRNANPGETIEIVSRTRRRIDGAHLFDVVVRRPSGETLAVSTEIGDLSTDRSASGARIIPIDGGAIALPGERPPALEPFLQDIVAETLGKAHAPLPVDGCFGELGWDSLTRLDVVARLESIFGPLQEDLLFRTTSIAGLAAHLMQHRETEVRRVLSAAGTAPGHAIRPDPSRRFEPFPLTAIQRAYLAGRSEAFPLGGKGCHLYWEFAADRWDVDRLERAWHTLVGHHDMLRATVSPDGSQQVSPDVPDYRFLIHDLRDRDPSEAADVLAGIRDRVSHHDFTPMAQPLFRIELSLLPDSMRLHFAIDMLAVDGPSLFLLFHQWSRLYDDPALELPPTRATFRDYALEHERVRESRRWRDAQAYWERRSLPPPPEPVAAADLAGFRNPHFSRLDARLAPAAWSAIQDFARDSGVTASAALLTAFAESLRLWLRSPQFTVNVTVASRMPSHADIPKIVGDFTSNVLVAIDCSRSESLAAHAARIHDQLSRDLDHSSVSGVEVLATLSRARGEAMLMPVVFTSFLGYAGVLKQDVRWNGLGKFVGGLTETPQVWLDCQVMEEDGALYVSWDVAAGVLPGDVAAEMFAAFHGLLDRLGRDAATWQEERRTLLPERQLQARQAANDTARRIEPALIHSAFLEQADRYPDWIAVVDERRTLTYGELRQIAAHTAAGLVAEGACRNRLVAVVMEKGWEEIAAVLAIAMAGAAYLPIDAALPPARIRQLLEIGEVDTVLTQSQVADRMQLPEALRRIDVDTVEAPADATPPDCLAEPSDLAYVIFTSGSTGVPKGVMIEHRSANNTIRDINERFRVGPRDRVLALSSLNFDLSVYDIFGVLGAGGAVIIPEAARVRDPLYLLALARRERVTIWNSVPSFLQMVVEAGAGESRVDDLRLAMLSGDWIPVPLPSRARELFPRCKTVSLGGATEASIWSICHPIDRVDPGWRSVPYGKPLANQTFHVLNHHMEDCPDGVPGELYIGGDGLAAGYWRDDEKTRASFIRHPATGARLYRTGDWGMYHADGDIEFLGRADLQVKVGGYRIELGEIDAALAQAPGISAALAVTFSDEHGQKRLAACAIPAAGGALDMQRIRAALAARLPAYMVPAHIFPLASFPLTPNGKVDRKALEAGAATRASAPPEEDDPFVQALASATLGLDPAGRAAFVDRQVAIRADLSAEPAIAFDAGASTAILDDFRSRSSSRTYASEPADVAQLGRLLSLLRSLTVDGRPKRRYPSAGGAYPIQVYLHVRRGRLRGLEAGVYYYHPFRNELQRVSACADLPAGIHAPVNQSVSAVAAFSIFLIADMGAIRPLYGDASPDLVKVEAGYMGQLLMEGARPNRLGLCPVGYLWFDAIRDRFRLGGEHLLVHSFLGGVYTAEARSAPTPAVFDQSPARPDGVFEDQIAAIWSDILRRRQLNRDQNFFEAGGTSFAAIEVHRRIIQLGVACTITDLFRHPTVRSLAAHLEGHHASPLTPPQEPPPSLDPDPATARRDRRRAARAAAGGLQ